MDDTGGMREALLHASRICLSREVGRDYYFNRADSFVRESRGSIISVDRVQLVPYDDSPGNYETWDKLFQGVGNFERINELQIHLHEGPPATVVAPDWEIVSRILSHIRQKVALVIDDDHVWGAEDVRGLSRAIQMNPMIERFEPVNAFPFESLDTLCSVLATLPALERVSFSHQDTEEGRRALALNTELLTELLRLPSLRVVGFRNFCFTRALCRAVAAALKEGSAIITFNIFLCSFSEEESAAMIASSLKRNETVTTFRFQQSPFDEAFCDAMAVSLLTNTLRDLSLNLPSDSTSSSAWLSSMFLAMGMNTGLHSLVINGHNNGLDLADEQLCAAMEKGLEKNSMLESLHLGNSILSGTNAASGLHALSFLRTNSALKRLTVLFGEGAMESRVSTFRTQAASVLEENISLESLIITMSSRTTKIEDYYSVVSALHSNTTLTYLALEVGTARISGEQAKELTSIIKKNYGLTRIAAIPNSMVDLHSILKLNRAGRRYLVDDGSSISKGVDVLSAVSDDINCLFLHLLENPRLCDRDAVEAMCSSAGDLLPQTVNKPGKREQTRPDEAKESRMRLI